MRVKSTVIPMACSTEAVTDARKTLSNSLKLAYLHMLLYIWNAAKIRMQTSANK